jgi:hypothetical protein
MRFLIEYMGARPGGRILLGLDPDLLPLVPDLELAREAIGLGRLAVLPLPGPARLAVVPPELASPDLQGGVALLLTGLTPAREHALLGTLTRRLAQRPPGFRAAVGVFPGPEWLTRVFLVSRRELEARARALKLRLEGAQTLRVRTAQGTDLTMVTAGRQFLVDGGRIYAGRLGNLPGGEVFVCPVENSVNGVLVVDVAAPGIGGKPVHPLRLLIRSGRVVQADGAPEAQALAQALGGSRVGEFGLGVHPALPRIGHPLADEKVLGTGHIGFGHNLDWGGLNREHAHMDCVFDRPSVWVDDRQVLADGAAVALP